MRATGGRLLTYLRNRIPWVIAVLAVVIAASTGSYLAASRSRSVEASQRESDRLRERVSDLRATTEALREELGEAEDALGTATGSLDELREAQRALRNCVFRSNPNGGPVVTIVPGHAPVGSRVEMAGACFIGRWRNERRLMSGRGIALLGGIDAQGREATGRRRSVCELIATADGDLEIARNGRMRGFFRVPSGGRCFKKDRTESVAPGSYFVILRCRECTVARFRVTSESGERNRLEPCRSGDYSWTLDGPGGTRAMVVFGVSVEPLPGVSCRFDDSLTLTIEGPAGVTLAISGNPATAGFDSALGRERTTAAWGWQNWCGAPGPFEIRAQLGAETKSRQFSQSPRCNRKGNDSSLNPIGPWMHGVAP